MKKRVLNLLLIIFITISCTTEKSLTHYVNPFLGTATLWEPEDLGYTRKIKERTDRKSVV